MTPCPLRVRQPASHKASRAGVGGVGIPLCLPLRQAVARRSSRYRNTTPAAGKLEEPDRLIELDRLELAGEG